MKYTVSESANNPSPPKRETRRAGSDRKGGWQYDRGKRFTVLQSLRGIFHGGLEPEPFLVILGLLLLTAGVFGVLGYWGMDTTVGSVHDAGLMEDRKVGVLVSMGVVGLGLTLMIVYGRRGRHQ